MPNCLIEQPLLGQNSANIIMIHRIIWFDLERLIEEPHGAILIATPAHRQMIAFELAQRLIDVDRLERNGDLRMLDAEELLAKFMTGNRPDPVRFYAAHRGVFVYLAANGFANDRDAAIFRYNNASQYVRAVNDYAAVLASDPAAFAGYYRWEIYYHTTAGDVRLPIGYVATEPVSVTDYLATHPQ